MEREVKKQNEKFILKHSSLSVILIYNVVILTIGLIFYQILPILMGYAPNFIESTIALGASYTLQGIIAISFAIVFGTVFFIISFKGINKWKYLLESNTDENNLKIHKIRRKCINLPYIIYIGQIFFTTFPLLAILLIVMALFKAPLILEVKIITIIFSFFSLAAVVSHTFSKKIFTTILLNTYRGEGLEGIRIRLVYKIFLQILPMFIAAVLITGILGYSRLMEEKGEQVYHVCKTKILESMDKLSKAEDVTKIFEIIKQIKVEGIQMSYFVVTSNGKIITSNGSTYTKTFNYYIMHPYKGDRVYGDTNESQGIVIKLNEKNDNYLVGIKFQLVSNNILLYFFICLLSLLIVIIFVLYYFSKALSGEISLVARSLTDIAEGEHVDLDKKLAVTSNDEIADLVIAFNKIQEREKEHIKEIEEKQAILMEQDRLASLGHLIGGIAHNLRTPIMSLSGGIEGLKDLISEYDESINDENVTKADHHEIAKEMNVWIEKMRPYCAYMSDIITAVKGQTTQPSEFSGVNFTLYEVSKRVEILMEHELKKGRCKLNMNLKADPSTKINGDISVLVQILNNLIVNATQAYDENGGEIDFTILEGDKVAEFIIKDYGCGIPYDVQKKLFKEMITTKGTKGTGLGLYMSYSNVKARLGGKMRFESEVGKGTTFYLSIPADKM